MPYRIWRNCRKTAPLHRSRSRRGPRSGSGVIWSSDGTVITNAHVARGTRSVSTMGRREFQATVASRDPAPGPLPPFTSTRRSPSASSPTHRRCAGRLAMPSAILWASSAPHDGRDPRGWVDPTGSASQFVVQADVRLAPGQFRRPPRRPRPRDGSYTMARPPRALPFRVTWFQNFLSQAPPVPGLV